MKQFAAAMIGAFLAFPALAISVAPAPTGSGTVEFSFTRFDGPMGRVAFNGTFPSLGAQGIFNGVPAQISATEALPDGTVMGFANLDGVSSVAFRYDYIDPGSPSENLLSFAPAPFSGVAVGERFLLGTLTYQNGAWFGSGDTPEQNIPSVFQFEIITRSNDGSRFNQFTSGTITNVVNTLFDESLHSTPEGQLAEADWIYVSQTDGNGGFNLPLGSLRVYDDCCKPSGFSNVGTIDLYGSFGSLHLDELSNPQGGVFTTSVLPLDPASPPVLAVPEPSTWAMLIAGFGLIGAATRRRMQVAA